MDTRFGISAALQRAEHLLALERPADAERELRRYLASDPDNPLAHAVLARTLQDQGQADKALHESSLAIHLGPDVDYCYYVHALVLSELDRDREAEQAAREALRLDPEDADYYALLAGVLHDQKLWQESLDAANQGLEYDAEHVGCLNIRASALVKLGRQTEAAALLDVALRRDPDNAFTHANKGWAQLQANQPAAALEHFREALRLEPNNAWAREGIIQALHARHLVYRLLLRYFFAMSRLPGKTQMILIVGAYVITRVLRVLGRQMPELQPYVAPILVLYVVFVFLSWTSQPLFDLLLRLSRFGRLALTKERVTASNWVGGLLAGGLLSLGLALVSGHHSLLLPAAVCALMIIPVSATYEATAPSVRRILRPYTIALGVVGGLAVVLHFTVGPAAGLPLVGLMLIGAMLFPWVANIVALRS